MRLCFFIIVLASTLQVQSQEAKKDSIRCAQPAEGWAKFRDFVYDNLTFPVGGGTFKSQDAITVHFVVNEKGELVNFFRYVTSNSLFLEEAIRVLKLSPRWIPAMINDSLVSQSISYKFYFKKPPVHYHDTPVDKKSLSLNTSQNEDHFTDIVHLGSYEFDSSRVRFYPLVDTNSYHANPPSGFASFGSLFKSSVLDDPSFRRTSTNISVTFDISENGKLSGFVLDEEPHGNDTAIVRALMQTGIWDPAFQGGLAAKQQVKLDFKYYEGEIMEKVEFQAARPPGYQKFVDVNLVYPYNAQRKSITGFVNASFVVEKDGSISNGEITKGLGYSCDSEVLKLITLMPKWTPAIHNGKKVRQRIQEQFYFSPFR